MQLYSLLFTQLLIYIFGVLYLIVLSVSFSKLISNERDKRLNAEAKREIEEKSCLWGPTDFKYKLTNNKNVVWMHLNCSLIEISKKLSHCSYHF
jgi:hypothetical protein